MNKNNKENEQVHTDSIFRYPLFRAAVLIPIFISIALFYYISSIAQLTFDASSFENFELFLTFMKFPILILSLALPFGTVAASNFRSIQFQKSLDNQEKVMQQSEIDFVRSMYFKELEYFVGKFRAIVRHGNFKILTEEDGYLIYARIYEESLDSGKYPFEKSIALFQLIDEYFTLLEDAILKVDHEVNSNVKLIILMEWLVEKTILVSHALGIKVIDKSASLKDMLGLVRELYSICNSLYEDKTIKNEPIKKILSDIQRIHKDSSIPEIGSTTIESLRVSESIKKSLKHSEIRKESNQQLNSHTFNLHI
jgi:hypothetical protein